MDNCCDSLIKYIIFVFNFFFFLVGMALIAIGSYMKIEMQNYFNFLDDAYLNTAVLFIVLGVIVVLISFFGCCGACMENSCMMFTFALLLALAVIVQVGGAIAIYVFNGDAQKLIATKMREGLTHYDPNSDDDEFKGVTVTWNQVQSDLKCCGVSSYEDWRDTKFSQGRDVPDDCCISHTAGCGKDVFENPSKLALINQQGCLSKFKTFVKDNVEVVGGVAITFVVLQFIGVLVSCMLANNMRRRSNYV